MKQMIDPRATCSAFHRFSPLPGCVPVSGAMAADANTRAPSPAAISRVASTEAESTTRISSTSGTRSTSSVRMLRHDRADRLRLVERGDAHRDLLPCRLLEIEQAPDIGEGLVMETLHAAGLSGHAHSCKARAACGTRSPSATIPPRFIRAGRPETPPN